MIKDKNNNKTSDATPEIQQKLNRNSTEIQKQSNINSSEITKTQQQSTNSTNAQDYKGLL